MKRRKMSATAIAHKSAAKGTSHKPSSLVVLTASLLIPVTLPAGFSDLKLESFKRFVNGEGDIKEAVVYRRISSQDGRTINQEWFRFGCQERGNTWYVQRLKPGTNDPTILTPLGTDDIGGASYTHIWSMSDKDVQIVEKTLAIGSGPQRHRSLPFDLMYTAVRLGIPKIEQENVRWQGTNFTTIARTNWTLDGQPLGTNALRGNVVLGTNDLPRTAKYTGSDRLPAGVVTYEYHMPSITGLPSAFSVKVNNEEGRLYRYEFLSLDLGRVDLRATGGYVPSMFAATNRPRRLTIWTNDLPYTFLNGRLIPAFETAHPQRVGSLIMATVAIIVTTFLALWYQRSKTQQKTATHKGNL
ncbi:MAG: hypothetical protein ACYDH9_09495 [Limisphaerales bacterium]